MNTRALLPAVCAVLFVGCATSKSLVWSGPKTIQGSGAVGEIVDGIHWYANGVPEGRWEVLGAVGTHHYLGGNLAWNAMAQSSAKGKAIKAAKQLGGSAVVWWTQVATPFGGGATPQKSDVEGTYLVVRESK